jgi:hypothetical protein
VLTTNKPPLSKTHHQKKMRLVLGFRYPLLGINAIVRTSTESRLQSMDCDCEESNRGQYCSQCGQQLGIYQVQNTFTETLLPGFRRPTGGMFAGQPCSFVYTDDETGEVYPVRMLEQEAGVVSDFVILREYDGANVVNEYLGELTEALELLQTVSLAETSESYGIFWMR